MNALRNPPGDRNMPSGDDAMAGELRESMARVETSLEHLCESVKSIKSDVKSVMQWDARLVGLEAKIAALNSSLELQTPMVNTANSWVYRARGFIAAAAILEFLVGYILYGLNQTLSSHAAQIRELQEVRRNGEVFPRKQP